ncbi:hypothetical protein [Oricola thermophila]|uniref:Uncharacterized protein n=1 Tax=Oricola thermophila TaxID=2742145 RepID=A0A6N1VH99_9HYPH|nr:hypothetical protein [Oricola thermophila]QKV20326.1 hypothetical protein HTY61_18670 [Oricola thermophila]
MSGNNDGGYDRKTLITAGAIFIGFALLVYFLPNIMLAIGGENRWLAGAVVFIVLVLPFLGLWLRGRMRRKDD